MWQWKLQPACGRGNAAQDKLTLSAFERQEPSTGLSVLMYSMSSRLKACCACVCCVRGGGLELVIHQSRISPLSLCLSLCLIAWAWGKVLIMFSFIQTINPEAQCTRVPPRETSHIWQRLCYYHHSLSGLLELPSFSLFLIQRCT